MKNSRSNERSSFRSALAGIPLTLVVIVILISACAHVALAADRGKLKEEWVEPITGMRFVKIEAGQFVMGSPLGEIGREMQEVQHEVTIARHYWLGVFEVTQNEWERVMENNPSHFKLSDRHPVEDVTWNEIQEFLCRLTGRSPGSRFRLPTEAEWEYSCRAGTETPYPSGETLTDQDANIGKVVGDTFTGRKRTTEVGSFRPNPWGLYDMQGNVWEWVQDEYCPYPAKAVVDHVAKCGNNLKVIRGGSWYFEADSARCALRYTHHPDDRGPSLGFRIVRESSE